MITLQTLGELTIRRDGQPLPPFKSRKVAALLIYLALNPGPQTRSHLAGLLWSDQPEKKALSNLRFALWNIHEVLEFEVFDANRITVEWLPHPEVQLDVENFLKALWQARSESTETSDTVRLLEQALYLYRGDLLAGFDLAGDVLFNEWLQQQRLYLHRLAVEAFYRLAAYFLEHHQLPAAIAVARRVLELEPWHEETHRLLMLALARSGQRSAALAQYAACRRALRNELETGPSTETRRLYERLQAAGATPRHNLPVPLTPFVGRSAELEKVLQLLDNPHCRLLTLLGSGGMGKTRLAQQAAAMRVEHFLNGVIWIEFETLDSSAHLLPPIAAHLGIEWRRNNLIEQLSHFLHEKELLLVLDGLEQLRADAGELAELLRAAPELKILATSRERLALQCEWVFPVAGLDFPTAQESTIANRDAVQLFLQTARRVDWHFELSPATIPAIRRICQLVQGMPLALELAAALLSTMSLDDIVHAVENNMRMLVTAAPDVPARHRSLTTVFTSAWNTLSDAERSALCRLTVFRGGFRAEAAQQVAQVSLIRLSILAEKSWLRPTATGRYELSETVRQFLLAEGYTNAMQMGEVQQAHARYFAALLAEQHRAIRASKSDALAEISTEIQNIRAAWRWAVQNAAVELLAHAAEGWGAFLELHSWAQEGADAFAQAHDLAIQAGNADGARLLAWEGLFAFRLADYSRAQALLETSLALARNEHTSAIEAFALNNLGLVAERLGQREQARTCLEASIQKAQATEDDWACARALNNLGYLYYQEGNYGQAQTLLEQALAIRRSVDDRFGIAKTLINLAHIWRALKEFEQLQAAYHEALTIFQELDNRLGVAICLNNLGFHAFQQQRYAEAQQLYEKALLLRREIGDPWGLAVALDNLGAVCCELGDHAGAQAYYAEALTLGRAIGATRLVLEVLADLARLAKSEGYPTRAVELLSCVLNHPELGSEVRERGRQLLAELKAQLPSTDFNAAVERGQALDWESLLD